MVYNFYILADFPPFGRFWREILTQSPHRPLPAARRNQLMLKTYVCMKKKSHEFFPPRRAVMPYKDLEKRRAYQCQYKRRQRAKEKMSNPGRQTLSNPREACQTLGQTVNRKAYLCPKVPHFRLPGIMFKNGFFVTDRLEEQVRIESDPLYGLDIFSWVLET